MYYTIYTIKNKINGKEYTGKHETTNLNDDYMGSGSLIKPAIKKYGKENFIKNIIFIYDNENDMDNKEAEIITEEYCARDDTYNIAPGGEGGNVLKYSPEKRLLKSKRISKKLKGKPKTLEHRKSISLFHADISGDKNPMFGKNHKDTTLEKLKQKALNREKQNCKYCGKLVDLSNLTRWHNDNCKQKL
jgi:group I intron endonuclease